MSAKRNVLGVLVTATDYTGATQAILAAARDRQPYAASAVAVHGVMAAVTDRRYAAWVNGLDLVVPDGQPVRWALNLLHGCRLPDRVYGPALMINVLTVAAGEGLPVYLYGSTPAVLRQLAAALTRRLPRLVIAGTEASQFRPASTGEAADIAARIAASGARLVLVGLGCPQQEEFVSAMRELVDTPVVAVGAAFDYHAGRLARPPEPMARYGLEWLWRLWLEPRRLWRRYLLLNPAFLAGLAAQRAGLWRPEPVGSAAAPFVGLPL